ncbi:MAG: glutaredoxin family protein [Methanoregulaceae archaeon]|nr:glutaredoxin family protein [Methanoregulaceae archaeon]
MVKMEHVDGKDRGKIVLFALSTCGWCARTKEFLRNLGVAFDYVFVDLLPQDELNMALEEVERYNPRGSFPTIVINGTKTIVGFREDELKEALA